MKHRAIAFVFAVCLASPLVFADNSTDAPLVVTDGNTPVVQQENHNGHKRQHRNKKDKSLSPEAKSKNASKSSHQGIS